jgi:hypothetical protein
MIVARKEAAQNIVVGPTKPRVVEGNTTYTYDIEANGLSKQITNNGENYSVYTDERGNTVKQHDTSYYTRKEYDDGSLIIKQIVIGPIDKTIRFGPLSVKLSELFAMGFILVIDGWKNSRNQKLRLTRGSEQYKLAKIPTHSLNQYQDLTMWVKDGSKPHHEPYTVEHKPKEIIKEVRVQTDPFEELMLRYPVRRKPVEFVGNQTLEQYVKQQLREQRRLENV